MLLLVFLFVTGCGKTPSSPPSPTATAKNLSYLDQAEQNFKAGKFQESSASALLAVEDTKAKKDSQGLLRARTLLACSESRLGSPPVSELGALYRNKQLDASSRARVNSEVDRLKKSALVQIQAAQTQFKSKKLAEATEGAEKVLRLLHGLGDRSRDGSLQYLLYRCYAGQGDQRKAHDCLEQAARARPPHPEARRLLGSQTAKAAAPRTTRQYGTDASGNAVIGSDGGLDIAISPEGYVGLSIQGSIGKQIIWLRRPDWKNFQKHYREMVVELEQYQRSEGGGTSRGVASSQTADLVLCVGTFLSSHGWECRVSRPVLEVWLCTTQSGDVTPWRSRPSVVGMQSLMRQVDDYLGQLPQTE